jgi:CBS domain-containing protein
MVVREILHAHVPYLTKESTVRDAVDKMDIYQFPVLVVVDKEGSPKGVLTEGDLCRAVSASGGIIRIASQPAYRYATKNPTCVHPNMEVSDALELMLSSGLTVLPVVEEKMLLGVVLRVDLMHAILLDVPPSTS